MRSLGVFALFFMFFAAFAAMQRAEHKEEDLSQLMDRMTTETKKLKEQIAAGKINKKHLARYGQSYHLMLTLPVSDPAKRGEAFDGFAKAFLLQTERLKAAETMPDAKAYNNLITACINCHNTYCPGPLTMLKRMKLPE